MHQATRTSSPFSLLIDPEPAVAAARRLESIPLRRTNERLDGKPARPTNPELAKFDEAVEMGKAGW